MIRIRLGKVVRFLASPRLATLLLAFAGTWAILASFVPQGEVTDKSVSAWATAHPFAESIARVAGLHHAFVAPLFAVCMLVLAVSTGLCAWQRTKIAMDRSHTLRTAVADEGGEQVSRHDLEIAYDPGLEESQALAIAAGVLKGLGIRVGSRGSAVKAASPAWSAWGSPVFHWALLGLMVTILAGGMVRSSGQMGLAVGQQKADEPSSYGILSAGPLRDSAGTRRTIRVDAFEPDFTAGGVDRGPTPTVTVLDAAGKVVASQRVYPNHTLKTGSLTIYPADYGLAATVSLLEASGAEAGRSVQLVDFSAQSPGGTAPIGYLTVGDASGSAALKVFVSIPLDRASGGFAAKLPADPRARVVVTTMDGQSVLDEILRPGKGLELPGGGTLKVLDLGYYARLQLVDDPSIPFLYGGLVVAIIGLGIATLTKQQMVYARVIGTPDGPRLRVTMRLWRNVATDRVEVEAELRRALACSERGGVV